MVHSSDDMIRTVFDALPSLIFVVDEDVCIQEYNTAAAGLMGPDRATILKRRAGDILHCIHASDVPEGCGRGPACKDCVVRNSVTEAFTDGGRVVRRRTRIELIRDGNKLEIFALITTSPFTFQGRPLALLVIEDISEIAELRRIIPICSICRKVRDGQAAWMQVEAYFKEGWDVDFSHSYCPDCYKVEMTKVMASLAPNLGSNNTPSSAQSTTDTGS